jgi:PAS domain S-box-containing protein
LLDHPASAPRGAPEAPGHSVRFYDRDVELLEEVADFLDGALRAGGLAIAIGTAPHLADLNRRLCGFGGVGHRKKEWLPGELVLLDAQETLDRFMDAGRPDAARFEAVIGPLLARAPAGAPVCAFGEMVAVLCEQGNYDGALALEGLWNDLATRHVFSLFCGYPWRLFSSPGRTRAFQHVCAAHRRVSVNADPAVDPGRRVAELQQQARALEAEVARHRLAEATLRQREQELAEFFENASEGIHKVAGDGTIVWANRAELEMLGYTWEEYVGRNVADFYVDKALIRDILERLQRGETLRDEAAVLRCRDGGTKPVLINSNACFDAGRLVYTRCFTRDASERVAREQAIEQRNRLLLQAPVGACILRGPQLHHELTNDRYCEMVGRRDIVGKTLREAFPELAGSDWERLLQRLYREGEPFVADEYPVTLDIGGGPEQRFYKLSIQALRQPSGATEGLMAIAVDVTDQVRARRRLEQTSVEREALLQELHEASRAKDEFLAMLGHELRNPLSPIVTALQLMRMRGDTGTAREQAIIQRQVEHLVRLVDDLLDISRITRGKIDLKREHCSLSTVLTKAIEQASLLLEQRSHRLNVEVEPELQWTGDPVRLAQVVANLLTNAARYTDVGGQITLRAWREHAQGLAISVKDNGNGISAQMLPRIFDLFFQGQRSVDRAEGGLGIGLALVRSLVQMHGGTVQAHSDGPGRGSEFVVRLPIAPQAAGPGPERPPAAAASTPAPASPALRPRRVLVVDDNVDAADSLGRLLGGSGHGVRVFHDPVAALQALPGLDPEVAILDIGLPVIDGYELGARIRETCGPGCRLIALSGYGLDADKARSLAIGFAHHLVKPVDGETVLALVNAS